MPFEKDAYVNFQNPKIGPVYTAEFHIERHLEFRPEKWTKKSPNICPKTRPNLLNWHLGRRVALGQRVLDDVAEVEELCGGQTALSPTGQFLEQCETGQHTEVAACPSRQVQSFLITHSCLFGDCCYWKLLLEHATCLSWMAAEVLPTSPMENQDHVSLKPTEPV